MKKCLLILQNLSRSGAPLTFLHMIDILKKDYLVDVMVYNAIDKQYDTALLDRYKQSVNNISFINLNKSCKTFKMFPLCYIKSKIDNNICYDYDLIITHFDFIAAYLSSFKSRKKKAKIVYYSLGSFVSKSKYKFINLRNNHIRKKLNNLDYYIALSENCFFDGFDYSNVRHSVLTDYPDFYVINKKESFSKPKKIVLGQIGYYCDNKNQLFSLSLLNKLIVDGVEATLKFIGYQSSEEKNYKNEMVSFIKNNNLQNKVEFNESSSDKNDFFKEIDLLLLPSKHEGLGLVLLESQIYGVSCLSSLATPKEANLGRLTKIDLNINEWANFIKKETFKKIRTIKNIQIIDDFQKGLKSIVEYINNIKTQ